jgi:hypothetical protein
MDAIASMTHMEMAVRFGMLLRNNELLTEKVAHLEAMLQAATASPIVPVIVPIVKAAPIVEAAPAAPAPSPKGVWLNDWNNFIARTYDEMAAERGVIRADYANAADFRAAAKGAGITRQMAMHEASRRKIQCMDPEKAAEWKAKRAQLCMKRALKKAEKEASRA